LEIARRKVVTVAGLLRRRKLGSLREHVSESAHARSIVKRDDGFLPSGFDLTEPTEAKAVRIEEKT
jgi:hypothetical protein